MDENLIAAPKAALDRLCLSPDARVQNDRLAEVVQFSLRVALSLNDYSRQDVRHCLKKIRQSCVRHNKQGGTRGYLNFIREMLRNQPDSSADEKALDRWI